MSTLTKTEASRAVQPASTSRYEYRTPTVNIHQSDNGYTLEVEVPGVGKEGVDLSVEDGKLLIVGHPAEVRSEAKCLHRERGRVAYRRVFDLDPAINTTGIQAHLEQGILRVQLPKQEALKARKIQVG